MVKFESPKINHTVGFIRKSCKIACCFVILIFDNCNSFCSNSFLLPNQRYIRPYFLKHCALDDTFSYCPSCVAPQLQSQCIVLVMSYISWIMYFYILLLIFWQWICSKIYHALGFCCPTNYKANQCKIKFHYTQKCHIFLIFLLPYSPNTSTNDVVK